MAKRFTDTDKWKKPLLKKMPAVYKLFWLYLCDDCDHAGIWNVDFDVASLRIGEKLNERKAIEVFGEKVVVFDNGEKWFIPSFIDFQYGELKENNRVHESVLKELNKYKLLENKPLTRPLQGAMDKDKDKDMDKEKEKGEKNKNWNTMPLPCDAVDLPENKIGSAIQLLKFTKQVDVSAENIIGMWSVFKVQNLTGKKFYKDLEDVHSHFINWVKTQSFKDKQPAGSITSQADYNSHLKAAKKQLQNEPG